MYLRMRFSHKIKKLLSSRGLASARKHTRRFFHRTRIPLETGRIIETIDGPNFQQIRQRYAVENPGEDWPKYLNLDRWIDINIRRIREGGACGKHATWSLCVRANGPARAGQLLKLCLVAVLGWRKAGRFQDRRGIAANQTRVGRSFQWASRSNRLRTLPAESRGSSSTSSQSLGTL